MIFLIQQKFKLFQLYLISNLHYNYICLVKTIMYHLNFPLINHNLHDFIKYFHLCIFLVLYIFYIFFKVTILNRQNLIKLFKIIFLKFQYLTISYYNLKECLLLINIVLCIDQGTILYHISQKIVKKNQLFF